MNMKFHLKGWLFVEEDSTVFLLVYCYDITALQLTFNCVMSETNKFRIKTYRHKTQFGTQYGRTAFDYLFSTLV